MLKYAKIINTETKEVSIANSGSQWVISQGYTEQNVEQSDITNKWYLYGYAPMYSEQEKAQKERERLNLLSLTKREVFLALYKDKGITPEQLRSQITDPEALIEFDFANDYYRGNPLIDKIGVMLGYSMEDLDHLFETGEFPDGQSPGSEYEVDDNEVKSTAVTSVEEIQDSSLPEKEVGKKSDIITETD